MARPAPNGKVKGAVLSPTRQVRGKSKRPAVLPPTGKPIGAVPKWFNSAQKEIWKTLCAELKWIDITHRRWLINTTMTAYRVEGFCEYFQDRERQIVKDGGKRAEAYLDDRGRRHPLHINLIAESAELRAALNSLGANPASQMKLLAQFGGVVDKQNDAAAGRFLS